MTDGDKKPIRNWSLHPSRNRFFLGGRLLTGGDAPWAFVASLTVVFTIAGVYFGTTAIWWWNNESIAVPIVAAYITLLTISGMFATVSHGSGSTESPKANPLLLGIHRSWDPSPRS